MTIRPLFLICALAGSGELCAQDTPEFDRPGIGFATSTVGKGAFAWEQGLPDGSFDKRDGIRTTAWVADSLLRVGLSKDLELQLGADVWGGVRVSGGGQNDRSTGSGDGSVGLKWAPTLAQDDFSLAILGTATLPWGKAPVGNAGHVFDIGVTGAWAVTGDNSLALYVDRQWGDDGTGWLISPSYNIALSKTLATYVEAGYGTGAQYMRAVGTGVTWMITPKIQLDASVLRGLDSKTSDWQGGTGIALYFD